MLRKLPSISVPTKPDYLRKRRGTGRVLAPRLRELVQLATVRLVGRVSKGSRTTEGFIGQGVLVPGGYVLTAEHCINWSRQEQRTLQEHYLRIAPRAGKGLLCTIAMADPIADIAALTSVDSISSEASADAFAQFCRKVRPVPLAERYPKAGTSCHVHVLTHEGNWVEAWVTCPDPAGGLPKGVAMLTSSSPIKSGSSGGPVVDDAGRLVGVISWTAEGSTQQENCGTIPIACLAIPRWVGKRIRSAQTGNR
jgi:S1-C subfamily serine protease